VGPASPDIPNRYAVYKENDVISIRENKHQHLAAAPGEHVEATRRDQFMM